MNIETSKFNSVKEIINVDSLTIKSEYESSRCLFLNIPGYYFHARPLTLKDYKKNAGDISIYFEICVSMFSSIITVINKINDSLEAKKKKVKLNVDEEMDKEDENLLNNRIFNNNNYFNTIQTDSTTSSSSLSTSNISSSINNPRNIIQQNAVTTIEKSIIDIIQNNGDFILVDPAIPKPKHEDYIENDKLLIYISKYLDMDQIEKILDFIAKVNFQTKMTDRTKSKILDSFTGRPDRTKQKFSKKNKNSRRNNNTSITTDDEDENDDDDDENDDDEDDDGISIDGNTDGEEGDKDEQSDILSIAYNTILNLYYCENRNDGFKLAVDTIKKKYDQAMNNYAVSVCIFQKSYLYNMNDSTQGETDEDDNNNDEDIDQMFGQMTLQFDSQMALVKKMKMDSKLYKRRNFSMNASKYLYLYSYGYFKENLFDKYSLENQTNDRLNLVDDGIQIKSNIYITTADNFEISSIDKKLIPGLPTHVTNFFENTNFDVDENYGSYGSETNNTSKHTHNFFQYYLKKSKDNENKGRSKKSNGNVTKTQKLPYTIVRDYFERNKSLTQTEKMDIFLYLICNENMLDEYFPTVNSIYFFNYLYGGDSNFKYDGRYIESNYHVSVDCDEEEMKKANMSQKSKDYLKQISECSLMSQYIYTTGIITSYTYSFNRANYYIFIKGLLSTMTIYDTEQVLKGNMVLSGAPGGGKSWLLDAIKQNLLHMDSPTNDSSTQSNSVCYDQKTSLSIRASDEMSSTLNSKHLNNKERSVVNEVKQQMTLGKFSRSFLEFGKDDFGRNIRQKTTISKEMQIMLFALTNYEGMEQALNSRVTHHSVPLCSKLEMNVMTQKYKIAEPLRDSRTNEKKHKAITHVCMIIYLAISCGVIKDVTQTVSTISMGDLVDKIISMTPESSSRTQERISMMNRTLTVVGSALNVMFAKKRKPLRMTIESMLLKVESMLYDTTETIVQSVCFYKNEYINEEGHHFKNMSIPYFTGLTRSSINTIKDIYKNGMRSEKINIYNDPMEEYKNVDRTNNNNQTVTNNNHKQRNFNESTKRINKTRHSINNHEMTNKNSNTKQLMKNSQNIGEKTNTYGHIINEILGTKEKSMNNIVYNPALRVELKNNTDKLPIVKNKDTRKNDPLIFDEHVELNNNWQNNIHGLDYQYNICKKDTIQILNTQLNNEDFCSKINVLLVLDRIIMAVSNKKNVCFGSKDISKIETYKTKEYSNILSNHKRNGGLATDLDIDVLRKNDNTKGDFNVDLNYIGFYDYRGNGTTDIKNPSNLQQIFTNITGLTYTVEKVKLVINEMRKTTTNLPFSIEPINSMVLETLMHNWYKNVHVIVDQCNRYTYCSDKVSVDGGDNVKIQNNLKRFKLSPSERSHLFRKVKHVSMFDEDNIFRKYETFEKNRNKKKVHKNQNTETHQNNSANDSDDEIKGLFEKLDQKKEKNKIDPKRRDFVKKCILEKACNDFYYDIKYERILQLYNVLGDHIKMNPDRDSNTCFMHSEYEKSKNTSFMCINWIHMLISEVEDMEQQINEIFSNKYIKKPKKFLVNRLVDHQTDGVLDTRDKSLLNEPDKYLQIFKIEKSDNCIETKNVSHTTDLNQFVLTQEYNQSYVNPVNKKSIYKVIKNSRKSMTKIKKDHDVYSKLTRVSFLKENYQVGTSNQNPFEIESDSDNDDDDDDNDDNDDSDNDSVIQIEDNEDDSEDKMEYYDEEQEDDMNEEVDSRRNVASSSKTYDRTNQSGSIVVPNVRASNSFKYTTYKNTQNNQNNQKKKSEQHNLVQLIGDDEKENDEEFDASDESSDLDSQNESNEKIYKSNDDEILSISSEDDSNPSQNSTDNSESQNSTTKNKQSSNVQDALYSIFNRNSSIDSDDYIDNDDNVNNDHNNYDNDITIGNVNNNNMVDDDKRPDPKNEIDNSQLYRFASRNGLDPHQNRLSWLSESGKGRKRKNTNNYLQQSVHDRPPKKSKQSKK